MQYLKYNERKTRGTVDFPIEFYHINPFHPRYVMEAHWHMEYELLRVLSGSLLMTLDQRQIPMGQGDVLLVPSGALHSGVPEGCVYECVVFDLHMLLQEGNGCFAYLQDISAGALGINSLFPREDGVLTQIAAAVFDGMGNKEPAYQLTVQGALLQLFGRCIAMGYYSKDAMQSGRQRRLSQVKQVLRTIERSYASPLTLEQLSREAGMSPKYFCRFFREMTQRTPMDYVNHYRIEQACYQLLTTGLSVTEIAYGCGFNDLSYFIRVFRRHKGVAPRQFLEQATGVAG